MRPGRRYRGSSWTFGTCKLTRTLYTRDPHSDSCCLVAGIHQLTCDASRGGGWPDGFIKIGKTHYCDNFYIGHQQTVDIEISGICTISNKRTALDYILLLLLDYIIFT